jgi:hypothetical protein
MTGNPKQRQISKIIRRRFVEAETPALRVDATASSLCICDRQHTGMAIPAANVTRPAFEFEFVSDQRM